MVATSMWSDGDRIALRRAAIKKRQRNARASFASFLRWMNPGYLESHHTRLLVDTLERVVAGQIKRLIVTMPPRHSKSFHVSQNLPAYVMGIDPTIDIILASAVSDLAERFSRACRALIRDPRYPFPIAISKFNATQGEWTVAPGGGTFKAVGRDGTPTGFGAGGLIIDDPFKSRADAESAAERKKVMAWIRGTLRSRLAPKAWIILTATRWHRDDPTGQLLAEQAARDAAVEAGESVVGDDDADVADDPAYRWHHLHMPAVDADGGALWPERYDLAELRRIRADVGLYEWQSQYQGDPIQPGGNIIKTYWWRFWQPAGVDLPPVQSTDEAGNVYEYPVMDLPQFWQRGATAWDATYKRTENGSFVVGLAGALQDGAVWILDEKRARMDFPETLVAVDQFAAKWPWMSAHVIEAAANGPAIFSTLQNRIAGMIDVPASGGKEQRAHALAPAVESGGVILPHPSIAPWVRPFIDELAEFPSGALSDRIDATGHLVRYLRGEAALLSAPSGALADYLVDTFGGW